MLYAHKETQKNKNVPLFLLALPYALCLLAQ
jgi:hypothetical protein